MIRTKVCELLGIDHPVALGGMPTIFNTAELAGAVSQAGGMGIIGATFLAPNQVVELAARVRDLTDHPFGLNSLVFLDDRDGYTAACDAGPALISLAWPRADQDLGAWISQAHGRWSRLGGSADAGCRWRAVRDALLGQR